MIVPTREEFFSLAAQASQNTDSVLVVPVQRGRNRSRRSRSLLGSVVRVRGSSWNRSTMAAVGVVGHLSEEMHQRGSFRMLATR